MTIFSTCIDSLFGHSTGRSLVHGRWIFKGQDSSGLSFKRFPSSLARTMLRAPAKSETIQMATFSTRISKSNCTLHGCPIQSNQQIISLNTCLFKRSLLHFLELGYCTCLYLLQVFDSSMFRVKKHAKHWNIYIQNIVDSRIVEYDLRVSKCVYHRPLVSSNL